MTTTMKTEKLDPCGIPAYIFIDHLALDEEILYFEVDSDEGAPYIVFDALLETSAWTLYRHLQETVAGAAAPLRIFYRPDARSPQVEARGQVARLERTTVTDSSWMGSTLRAVIAIDPATIKKTA